MSVLCKNKEYARLILISGQLLKHVSAAGGLHLQQNRVID
jgi:hypothetical protein